MVRVFCLILLSLSCSAVTMERLGDFLMWFPGGGNPYLWPSNAVASIEEVARVQAQAVANASAADMLQEAMLTCNGRISQVEDVIAAQEQTLYIDKYNVLRLGEQIQTEESDATLRAVRDQWNIGQDSTWQTNVVWGWCSVDPGFLPYVRLERNLSTTNEWNLGTVTSQTVEHDILIGDTLYDTLFRVEFITPVEWGSAFVRLEVNIRGAGTNTTFFTANNGFAVKGKKPVSFDLTVGTNRIQCVGGGFTDQTTLSLE